MTNAGNISVRFKIYTLGPQITHFRSVALLGSTVTSAWKSETKVPNVTIQKIRLMFIKMTCQLKIGIVGFICL